MKNNIFLYLTILISLFFFSCASTPVTNPNEFIYKDISASEIFSDWDNAFSRNGAAYKVSDVWSCGSYQEDYGDSMETLYALTDVGDVDVNFENQQEVYATKFTKEIEQKDSTWASRVDAVKDNKKYNGHYTVYLYGERQGNFLEGYETKVFLHKIEGVPSQEQLYADEAEKAEKKRLEAEKKATEEKANAEKDARLDVKGKALAKGYTYHGIAEKGKNAKLFANGALEVGHAYYIPGFVVKYGGSMAKIEYADGFFFSSQSSAVYVDYISQQVKADVVEAGVENFFGQTIEIPIIVVVTGGKGYAKTPVVLGLVEEDK